MKKHEATIIIAVEIEQEGDRWQVKLPDRHRRNFAAGITADNLDDFVDTLEYQGIGVKQIRTER